MNELKWTQFLLFTVTLYNIFNPLPKAKKPSSFTHFHTSTKSNLCNKKCSSKLRLTPKSKNSNNIKYSTPCYTLQGLRYQMLTIIKFSTAQNENYICFAKLRYYPPLWDSHNSPFPPHSLCSTCLDFQFEY